MGALLGVAGLEAEEQSGGGLAYAFAGGGDQGLASAGDAAGDGGLGGYLAGGVAGGVDCRLTGQVAGKVQAGKEQADGNGRPGQGGKVVERLQKAHYPGIFLLPLVEFAAKEFAIVLVHCGQLLVGRLDPVE